MPEICNIQTFEKIAGSDIKPMLDRFSNILESIGLWNIPIKESFDNFEWKVEDDGFVYSSIANLDYFAPKIADIKIRPFVNVYTPAIETFDDN